MTHFEIRHGITSVVDASHDQGAVQLFLHCYASQPNVNRLAGITDGVEKYPERALMLACPNDVICVKDPVEREYVEFLASLGPAPEYDSIVVADPFTVYTSQTPLSDQIAADSRVLHRIDRMLAHHGTVWLNCYMFTEAEARLARLLESALGRVVRTTGGSAAAVAKANQKHLVRAKARELGIPVAPGEAVTLPTSVDGRPRGMTLLDKAIRDWLPLTGKVIIRGTLGAAGSNTFLVDSMNESRRQALAEISERSDSSVYLVEAMLPTTVSPNIGLFISPRNGRISCVSVTDQILTTGLNYSGNTYPSRSANIDGMIAAARALTEWLRECGMTGYVGFDFCEYEPEAGGGPEFFLSEINPRVNGATYAAALRQKVNLGLSQAGARPVESFAAMFVDSQARTFSELRRLLGRRLFDPAAGAGIVPFNTGCLPYGKCLFAVLGESLDQVRNLSCECSCDR